MDIGELHHLLFRWLHVTSAVVWVGHLLSVMAPAVILLMVSNHFPLVYGTSRPWLMAPTLIALGYATGLAIRWLSLRRLTLR